MRVDCFPNAIDEWERKAIGAIADVNPTYHLDKRQEYPFIEMASVAENFGGILHFDRRKPESSGLARFKQNDILFGKITPCAENGKVTLVDSLPAEFGIGSTEFIVLSPHDGINPRYLYALVCSNPVHGRAVSRMEGSTGRLRITEDTFTKWLAVPVPHKDEQEQIAKVLDAVDMAIARAREVVEKAKQLRTSLVQTLFTRGLGQRSLKQTEIGAIPCGWEVMTIGDAITEAQYGLSMPMSERGEYPILRMAAIQDGDILLDDLKYVDLSSTIAERYLLHRDDVIFNRTNSAELLSFEY
jgi:type I restriction enzyme S subunit